MKKRVKFRGFTLQFLLFSILPLTILLVAVAFGSQALHNEAMRNLVGDRDLQTVQAASGSIGRELEHLQSSIEILSRSVNGKTSLDSLILSPAEISAAFDGGVALFGEHGNLVSSSSSRIDWQAIHAQVPEVFQELNAGASQTIFSNLLQLPDGSIQYVLLGVKTADGRLLLGAFSPSPVITSALGDLATEKLTTVWVISKPVQNGNDSILFESGPKRSELSLSHPGVSEVLKGESGIKYYSNSGEQVVAFASIAPTGWGLIIEESWQDIASPYLISTQSASLVIVPAFLLALLAIWFGVRRIVTPLRRLEGQAALLAGGDFETIHEPVGGIQEITNLQSELAEMAHKLAAAQASLKSYIGAITAGVENERQNLARELHDDTIQSLIALNQRIQMNLQKPSEPRPDNLSELQELVQRSIVNLRRLIRGLRPIYLEDLGLAAALEMLAEEIEKTSGFPVRFLLTGEEKRLEPSVEISLYRMAQESLNNILRHADAAEATLNLEYSENRITMRIGDNGKGFTVPSDPAEFSQQGHFGLLGLHERAEIIGAELQIISTLGVGTLIQIILPIR